MPDGIDTEVAYVIYCDDDHDVGELWRIDLVHGHAGVKLALAVVDWRKQHSYGRDLARLYEFAARTDPPSVGQPVAAEPSAGSAAAIIADPPISTGVERRAGTDSRQASGPAKTMLQQGIEATEHRRQLTTKRNTPAPVIVEGGDVDPATVTALEARFRYLDAVDRSRIIDISKAADAAGFPFTLKDHPSRRRWEIMRALVLWCEAGWSDTYVRTALYVDTGYSGMAFWLLAIDQAQRFGDQAQAVIDGQLTPDSDSDRLIPSRQS